MEILYNLFAIPVIRIPITDIDYYNKIQIELKNVIEIIKNNDDFSNVSYYANKKYENKEYNFLKKYNCINLEKQINISLEIYLNTLRLNYQGNFNIVNSWLNIIHSNDHHEAHSHPGHTISGVYYFRVNEQQGGICFKNPNTIITFGQFPQGCASPMTTTIIPDDGDIILFPSWLEHFTRKNNTNEDRISIAFNIDYDYAKNNIGLLKDGFFPYHDVKQSLRI